MTADWQNFFTTIAQVSVTAFAIMFLVMQARSRAWRGRRLLNIKAVASLVELFVPLLIALVASMGSNPWRLAALLGSALGLGTIVVHAAIYQLDKARDDSTRFDRIQVWGGGLAGLIVYGSLVIASTIPTDVGLHLLSATCIWLLLSGSFEAWWLLEPTSISKPEKGRQGTPETAQSTVYNQTAHSDTPHRVGGKDR